MSRGSGSYLFEETGEAPVEGRVGFEPTTPGLKVRDPFDEPGPTTCLKSRRPPFGGPHVASVVTSDGGGAGDGNRTRDNLLGRQELCH
jgi:hypothetical protein